jgi:hypothetical protein
VCFVKVTLIIGICISLTAWTQLEELKQQQKLDRQMEQEKKRKRETNPGDEPSNAPVEVGLQPVRIERRVLRQKRICTG